MSFSQVVVEDTINENKYSSYVETMELIEKNCKVNGVLDKENCNYDLSEIESVEYKDLKIIYNNCLKKYPIIYSTILLYPYSVIDSPEDFNINSILNKIKAKLNKLMSFEDLITNYLCNKLNINPYNKNLENMNKLNITGNKNATDQLQSYNNYIRQLFYDLFPKVYSVFFLSLNYAKIKENDLDLLYDIKYAFYRNYSSEYKKHIDYFIEHLKKIKNISPSLKSIAKNLFSEIEENRINYLDNWKRKVDNFIDDFYDNGFSQMVKNHFLNFIKNKFDNNDYLINNFNIIFDNNFINNGLKEHINSLINEIKVKLNNNDNPFEEISDPNIEDNENDEVFSNKTKEINDILINLKESNVYSENATKILNYTKNRIEKFYNDLNLGEPMNITDKLKDCFQSIEDLSNSVYNETLIEKMYSTLFKMSTPSINEEEIINLTKNTIEEYNIKIKDIAKEINLNFKNRSLIINNYIDTLIDDINKAVGKMGVYTLIDGYNYIDDDPCRDSKCPYTIDLPSFQDVINKKSEEKNGRRLEEKDYIKELSEAISEMKKIIHKSSDFRIFNISENYKSSLYNKRKLEFYFLSDIDYEYYTWKDGARDEAHLNLTINKIERNIGVLTDILYYHIRDLEQILSFDFLYPMLTHLKDRLNMWLYLSENSFGNQYEFDLFKKMIIKYYNILSDFISKRMDIVFENSKRVINELKDHYLYLSLINDVLPNYILNYYRTLNQIISVKAKSRTEKEEFNVIIDLKKIKEKMEEEKKRNEELLKKTAEFQNELLKKLKKETEKEEEENDYDDVRDFDYGYGDPDEDDGQFKKAWTRHPDDNKEEEPETKLEKLAKKMQKAKISLESEITYEFKNWSNWEKKIKTNAAKEWGWDDHASYQFPIVFAAFPALQFRFGIKIELYVKLKIGIEIALNLKMVNGNFKPSLDISLLIDFSLGIKVNVFAEVGLYGGVASLRGGIEGTLADVKLGLRILINFVDKYTDIYIYILFNAFRFTVYIVEEVDFKIWKGSAKLVDISFGMDKPLFECSFLIRFNFYLENSEPVKTCEP